MQEYTYFMDVAEQLERIEDFAGAYECWLQVLQTMPENDYELQCVAMEHVSYLAYKQGMYARAISTLVNLLLTMKAKNGNKTVRYADLLNKLASLYYLADDLNQAKDAILEAKTIYEALVLPDHPSLRAVNRNLSRVYQALMERAVKLVSQPVQYIQQAENDNWMWFCDMNDLTKLCAA